MVAITLVAIGISGAVTTTSVALKMGRESSETAQAQASLRSLLETARNSTFSSLTTVTVDSTQPSNNLQALFAAGTFTPPGLNNTTVTVNVYPYAISAGPTGTASSAYIQASYSNGTTTTTTSGAPSFVSAALVEATVSWIGSRGRAQQAVTIVSRGGILGINH